MSIAYSLLLICIVFASGSAVRDGSSAQSLIAILAAAALTFVSGSARAVDVQFASRVTRGLKYAAAVPAIWMMIQLLPIPFGAHSIWSYANDALDHPAWGHISVDLGATVLALAFYLANLSVIAVTIFVARDRHRSELILIVVTALTTITVLVLLARKWGLIAALAGGDTDDVLGTISALGILLSLTSGVRAIERYESKQAEATRQNLNVAFAGTGLGLLCCGAGLAGGATANVALVAGFGFSAFASVQVIRRTGMAGWATGTLAATMLLAAVMLIVWRYDSSRALSPFLQFSGGSSEAIAMTQRLLSDTSPLGTGAGTFAAMLPIYQDLGSAVVRAPSSASALAIELGSPMALFAIAVAIWLILVLYRGAVSRGRDSFYPAAGAACTVVILGTAFCDASLLNASVAVVGDAVIGLGLAQSVSGRDSP